MTPRTVLVVRTLTTALLGVVILASDWSLEAAGDPARILFLGPEGVLVAARQGWLLTFPVWLFLVFLIVGIGYVETGIALAKRRPDSRVGFLLVVAGLLWLAHGLRRSSQPGLFTIGLALTHAYNPVLLQLALTIPAGRLRGRTDRALVVAVYVYFATVNLAGWLIVDPRRLLEGIAPRNVMSIANAPDVWHRLQPVLTTVGLALGLIVLGVLILRFARGSPLYRYAFAPMWFAGLAKVTGNLVWLGAVWLPAVWAYAAFLLGSATIPVAAAVSLVRSRPRATAMTRVVREFGQDHPDAAELRESLRRSTADPTLDLLRFDEAEGRLVTLFGTPSELPRGPARVATALRREGRDIGVLVHDAALADSPEVLHAVQRMAALVLDNEQLLERVNRQLDEVRQSRRRIVEAGDAERARIERNMHDAVQQRLVAAALVLRRAERAASVALVSELLHQGTEGVETALRELREVVRGLHPPVLVERGLPGAIESICERSTVAVHMRAELGTRQLPAAAAITAYYIAAEAVTNVEKHAAASCVTIGLRVEDEKLVLTVDDDGIGGALFVVGGGLAGLRDRVEAYGGNLAVRSVLGLGTQLKVAIPLGSDAHREATL